MNYSLLLFVVVVENVNLLIVSRLPSPSDKTAMPTAEEKQLVEETGGVILESLYTVSLSFLQAKMAHTQAVSEEGEADKLLEDPLEEHSPHNLLIEMGACMRFHVERFTPIIVGLWDQNIAALQSLRGQTPTSEFVEAFRAAEGQLSWLAYLIAALLEGLAAPGTRPLLPAQKLLSYANLYGQLTHKVFAGMTWFQSARDAGMNIAAAPAWVEFERSHGLVERFELASLHLCAVLYRVCSAESSESPPTAAFFSTLTSLLRVDPGGQSIVEGLVVKIVRDLNNWAHSPRVIDRTLTLFDNLSSGLKIVYHFNSLPKVFSNAKLLLECDFVQGMLHADNATKFPFLLAPSFRAHIRRQFWTLLTRLFVMEDDEQVEVLYRFLSISTLLPF
jgi:hypothetical protein